MDKLDRLIMRAKPKPTVIDRLRENNPYLGKDTDELLDMMCPETPGGYCAPAMRTPEWNQFIFAVAHSVGNGDMRK